MLNGVYVRIIYLFGFLFLFLLSMFSFIRGEFLYLLITLYGLFLILLKVFYIFYFENKKGHKNNIIKSLFFFIIFFVTYFISFNITSFLLLIFYIFLLIFKVKYDNFFTFGIILFFISIVIYFFDVDVVVYSTYLAFSMYSFIFGIIYFLSNLFLGIDKKMNKNKVLLLNIFTGIFISLFVFSLYFVSILNYIPFLFLFILFILNFFDFKILITDFKRDLFKDIGMFGLYVLIFLPIISDFLTFENKNLMLFFSFLSFIVVYVGFVFTIFRLKR